MKVRYHRISNVDLKPPQGSMSDAGLADLRRDPVWAEHCYAFTTLRALPDGQLYIGTTHMNNRIFWRFDPKAKTFHDLGYAGHGTRYDIKIHRSLEFDAARNVLYGISAGLHNESEYFKAPGSQMFQFDLATGKIEMLGTPLPHEYTQTITLDPRRRLIYGFTYHTFAFYVFDVDKRKTIFHALPGSISHISAIDDAGCIWSTWGRNRHWIYKYDPQQNDIVWTKKRFPEGGQSYMYAGAGPIDCMLNGGDGYLYVALETGSLVRLDPKTGDSEYLGRPSPHPRMPALVQGEDGLFYGTCGDDWNVSVFTFDRRTRGFTILGRVACGEDRCFRPHDIALMGKTIYVAETDNPVRSGYLWEMTL